MKGRKFIAGGKGQTFGKEKPTEITVRKFFGRDKKLPTLHKHPGSFYLIVVGNNSKQIDTTGQVIQQNLISTDGCLQALDIYNPAGNIRQSNFTYLMSR